MHLDKIIHILLSFAIILFASCGNSVPQADTTNPSAQTTKINDLHWLAGWWQMSTPDGMIFEKWNIAADGSLAAVSGFIKGTDTMLSENIVLLQQGDSMMYIPTVKGQNNGMPIPFKLTGAAADSFVFENPRHDFPNKITYRKTSATSLVARVSGKPDGNERSETFEMNKIQ